MVRTKSQSKSRNTGKILLLTGVIVIALAVVVFSYVRLNSSPVNNVPQGEEKHMKPSVRGKSRHSPNTGQ